MFAGIVRAFLSEAPFGGYILGKALPTNIGLGWKNLLGPKIRILRTNVFIAMTLGKPCQGQTFLLIAKISKLRTQTIL